MAIRKLDLKSLADLDGGKPGVAFAQALARCESDCRDRPGVSDARRISITVEIVPVVDETGELHSCDVRADFSDKLPKRATRKYNMITDDDGGILFNDGAPENARQGTIDNALPKGDRTDAD